MKASITGVLLALTMLLAACSQATAENYAKLKNGMTSDQVHHLLGKPVRVSGGGIGELSMTTETYKGPENLISVTYGNDKVVMKSIGSVTDAPPGEKDDDK